MYILGLSCFYHDSAAALIKDGELIAAAQEERFTRKKHDSSFPENAARFCLNFAGITAKDLSCVAFYEKPLLKFDRIITTYAATFPRSLRAFMLAMPVWLKEKLWMKEVIKKKLGYDGEILFPEHHLSHAASSFLVSEFDQAAILTADAVGEWATTTYGVGKGNEIEILGQLDFPHSLGLFYSAFTYYLGFKVNSAEYKVMGLAPYGKPEYYDFILKKLIDVKEDGTFRLNLDYFTYPYGLTMTNRKFVKLFGHPLRKPEESIGDFHRNLAASLQKVTDLVMVRLARSVQQKTKLKNLCMAGGVAFNCVSNRKILDEAGFERLFIQPAAGDAGGAIGAAFAIWNLFLKKPRTFVWPHAFWGPEFSDQQIETFLAQKNVRAVKYEKPELLSKTASFLAEGKVIGWFAGREEFGPRALGNRSILADPRKAGMKDLVNAKIKFRESFRPFAPSVLSEESQKYFDLNSDSPYMLLTAPVKNSGLPAITHVDGTARLQTVKREQNSLFYDLLAEFEKKTGSPVLLNTSFNLRGEPIVSSPEDAYHSFLASGLDYLVLGSFLLDKAQMAQAEMKTATERALEPD
ncbi:MAG TPA: carbamoyltransferase [Verrucomicrobiae bacterium]|nr:carbamoyltransferase [Verrucomicrobiae bacterium]